jgi:hypothetical protein
MAVQHGKDGSVKLTATAVASVSKWSANIGAELHETTPLGKAWVDRIPGVKDITGSFSCYLDPADASGQEVLRAAAIGPTKVTTLRLYVDSTHYYSGPCYITMSYNISQGSVSTVDFNFSSCIGDDGTTVWTYT